MDPSFRYPKNINKRIVIDMDANKSNESVPVPENNSKDHTSLLYSQTVRDTFLEIVENIRNDKLAALKPRGYLLIDQAEEGNKSCTFAKNIAKEAQVPFFYTSAENLSKSSEIQLILMNARKYSKAVIFVANIDKISTRAGPSSNLDKLNCIKSLNKLLAYMDKMNPGIIFFASIKSMIGLDNAVMRPGRFDHYINLMDPLTKSWKSFFLAFFQRYWRAITIVYIAFVVAVVVIRLLKVKTTTFSISSAISNVTHQVVLDSSIKFENVQGCEQVKEQLVQIVEFLKNPKKYERFGATMPRGYLLSGPPGVGKTMLAKAVAGEAGVPFFAVSGSELEDTFIGVGASRIRSLFTEARKSKTAVIFIDEIDVAGKRDGPNSLDSHRRQTLNQLLTEMDGFSTFNKKYGSVIVLAATNSSQSLDPAILRPGRFDHTLVLSPPDIGGRRKIITNILLSIPTETLAQDLNIQTLARVTIGYTGADLANLINRAKLIASKVEQTTLLTMHHFLKAKDFISFGPERELIMSEKERERTAYHEAGHAVVALATSGSFPVQQATIVPYANSLGLVLSSPDDDINNMTVNMLKAKIDMLLAGFIAEEMKYQTEFVTTGPSSDLKTLNETARRIVRSGFGTRTGFFQHSIDQPCSEWAKQNFDQDVTEILNESEQRVRIVLNSHEMAWIAIAKGLLEHENLNREQLEELFKSNMPRSE